jgi:hypothetical protein
MRRQWILALSLAAGTGCDQTRTVELYIGPTRDTVSDGFSCLTEGSGDGQLNLPDLMPGRAYTPMEGMPLVGDVDFSMVIDFIELQGLPGCRGEEIVAWCEEHECKPMFGRRWCQPVHLEALDFRGVTPGDLLNLLAFVRDVINAHTEDIYDQLRMGDLFSRNAPDEPVIVRAVATLESCDDVMRPNATNDGYNPFNLSQGPTACEPAAPAPELIGCAYSCPVLLDQVTTAVTLSIDSATARCEPVVRVCAGQDLRILPECIND